MSIRVDKREGERGQIKRHACHVLTTSARGAARRQVQTYPWPHRWHVRTASFRARGRHDSRVEGGSRRRRRPGDGNKAGAPTARLPPGMVARRETVRGRSAEPLSRLARPAHVRCGGGAGSWGRSTYLPTTTTRRPIQLPRGAATGPRRW